MTINFTTLFTRLGKFFNAANTIQTALQTTIEAEVEDAVQELGSASTIDYEVVREGILTGLRALQADCYSALYSCVVTPASNLIIQTVKDDVTLLDSSISSALSELIAQMIANDESLDASTPAVSVSYGADNVGNGVLVTSVFRGDGKINEYILAETITGVITAYATRLYGELYVGELYYNWPIGSGCSASISSGTASRSDNLIYNGTFETADTQDVDLPYGWIVSVGVTGTTIKLTNVEVQTVVMSGTPTTGYYLLHFTDRDGKTQTTAPIAYNASGTTVQAALTALTGLSSISISTTGTSPNYTHTITFTGIPNPGQLTSTEYTDSGSIAHATTDAGSANVVQGARALELDSDGAEYTTLQAKVGMYATTQYAANVWVKCDVVPAAGRYAVELVDGIGGSVIEDQEGFQNTCYFDAANLTTNWQSLDALVTAANAVQRVTITGTPTGGNFTLTYDGATTGNIAYNASAADVKTALEALSTIGTGDIATAGGALPGAFVTVTFQNALGNRNVPAMTASGAGLTGGTGPAVAITTTTQGNPASPVFRTPAVMPTSVYFRLRAITPVSNGTSVFFDELCLVPMLELYAGGLSAALFTGPTYWSVNDVLTLTVTNDRAGAMSEWMNRIFGLRASRLLMPTNRSGAETQDDTTLIV